MTQDEVCRVYEFTNKMLMVRDHLDPIVKGEIKRGHCLAGNAAAYGGQPGLRKTTLKDARAIAKLCQILINNAVNEIDDME